MFESDSLKYLEKLNKLKSEFNDKTFNIIRHYIVNIKNKKKTRLVLECKIDKHIWDADYSKIKNGTGCPQCKKEKLRIIRTVPTVEGSLYNNNKNLLVYLKNIDDAKIYKPKSRNYIDVICPNCGYEDRIKIIRLVESNRFACPICYDGISIPEKFMSNILRTLNIQFEHQKTFAWSKRKRYDFYIEHLNIIIEVHGMQHYKDKGFNGKSSLDYEIKNDSIKRELASKNNIYKYIEIDCRYSDLYYLTEAVKCSLDGIIDLKTIDFDDIWKSCQNSKVIEVCNSWNHRKTGETTKNISNSFNMSKTTIIKYLKTGTSVGICDYDANLELKNSLFK